jgi:hypothetical protein
LSVEPFLIYLVSDYYNILNIFSLVRSLNTLVLTCLIQYGTSTIVSQRDSQENIESESLDNNQRKKAKQDFEKSEHEHSDSCGCGS